MGSEMCIRDSYQSVEFMVEQSYYDEEIVPLTEAGELVSGLSAVE